MTRVTMVVAVRLFVFIQEFQIICVWAEEPKTPITCDAGMFYAGEEAAVICNFHRDMAADMRAVFVHKYPKNATTAAIGTEVLKCEWKTDNLKYECDVHNGFTHDTAIRDRLTLKIPTVSEKSAGFYNCFLLPAGGTDPHACELTVTVGKPSTKQEDDSNMIWLVVLLVIPAAAVLVFFLYRRRRSRNRQSHSHMDTRVEVPLTPHMDTRVEVPLIQGVDGQEPVYSQMKDEKLEEFVKGFQLSTQDCRDVMQHIEKQMDRCHTDNDVYRRPLPQSEVTVNSAFLVVDLGSGNLKIQLVKFKANKKSGVWSEHYHIPQLTRRSTRFQLFDFIADCVKKFVNAHDMSDKNFRVAFVFSFPCKNSSDLTQAYLTKWTKEFNCSGFDNKDLRELLQNALPEDKMSCVLDVKIVVNDAVGALVSAAYDDPSCKLSLVVGNGFYSCYINEQWGKGTHTEFVKAEMGALSVSETLAGFITEYDKELDQFSLDPGGQILEKMVSIMYLGEILRLVLVKLSNEGLLFIGNFDTSKLKERGSIDADDVSLIESDKTEHHYFTSFVLAKLKLQDCSDEDLRIVRYVCGIVSERGAFLAAAGLAALINRMNTPDMIIAADGPSLNIYHPRFYGLMQAKTEELVKPGTKFKIVCSQNGSAIGAALAAEARQRQPPVPSATVTRAGRKARPWNIN